MSFLKRLLGPRLAVGLDIGSSAIKLVELRLADGQFHLQRLGIEPLSPEAIVDGAIMDSSLVVDAIHRLSDQTRLKNTMCATSLSGHWVIIKKIQLPAMSEEELAESIQWEVEQYIPFDINDVRLDYMVLSDGEPGRDNMEVVFVAIKRDKVNDYVSVISQTGKIPAIVDVDVFAVQNAYEVNYQLDPRKVVALINMGAAETNINILARGGTVFWRDISFGGNQFTEALQREFNLSFSQAEGLKQGEAVDRYSPADARPVLDAVSAEMASEIRKTVDFFSATSSEGPVDELVLAGGCALTPNLQQVLRERFQVPTELMNPLRQIQYKESDFDGEWLRSIAPMMAIAVGLATRSVHRAAKDSRRRPTSTVLQALRNFVLEPREAARTVAVVGSTIPSPGDELQSSLVHTPPVVPREAEVMNKAGNPAIESSSHGSPASPASALSAAQRPLDLALRSTRAAEREVTDAIPRIGPDPVPAPITQPTTARAEISVFISYAREDFGSAMKVYDELCAAGLEVWLDRENLLPGQRWRPVIENAIQTSDVFIALLSSSGSSRKGYLHKELRKALDILEQMPESEVFLIPARLDDCEPTHSALREIHWVDLFPDWHKGMEQILRVLKTRKSL